MWDVENECEIDHTKCGHYRKKGCMLNCMCCTHLHALRAWHFDKHNDHLQYFRNKDHHGCHDHGHKDCDIHGRACPYYTQDGVPININSDAWPGNPPLGVMGADSQNNIYVWNGERWELLSDTLGLDLVITTAKLGGLDLTDAPDGTDVAMPGDGMAYNRYALDFRSGVWLRNRIGEVDEDLKEQIERFESWLIDVWNPANAEIVDMMLWRYNTVAPFITSTEERLYQIELFISTPIPASHISYRAGTVADALDAIVDVVPLLPTRTEFEQLVALVNTKPDTVNRVSPILDSTGRLNITLLAGDIKFINDTGAEPYDETSGYTTGDLVVVGGLVYAAQTNITAPAGTFNPALWRLIPTIEDEFSRVVYKESGKGLSTNDFTDVDREALFRAMSYVGQFTSLDAANNSINSQEMMVVTMILSGAALQNYKDNTLGVFASVGDLPADAPNGVFAYITNVGPYSRTGDAWVPTTVDPHWIGFVQDFASLPTDIPMDWALTATIDLFTFFSGVQNDPGIPTTWTAVTPPDLRIQGSVIVAAGLGYVFDQGNWIALSDGGGGGPTIRVVFHSGGTAVITDQATLTQAWETAGGSMPIPDGANLIDLDNDFFVYAFFQSSMRWFPRGTDHVGLFQAGVPGMITGSAPSPATQGRIRARDDGTGEVIGFSELQGAVTAMETSKQNVLTAGANIDITGNVISAPGLSHVFKMMPKLEAMEATNRWEDYQTTYTGTWTCDRLGYVQTTLYANAQGAAYPNMNIIKVNGVDISTFRVWAQANSASGSTIVFEVKPGDVISFDIQNGPYAGQTRTCFFIPPIWLEIDIQTNTVIDTIG